MHGLRLHGRRFRERYVDISTEAVVVDDDIKFGFQRQDMYTENLSRSVRPYEHHVLLCYKTREDWASRVESSHSDLLPKRRARAIKERKNDIAIKNLILTYSTFFMLYGMMFNRSDVIETETWVQRDGRIGTRSDWILKDYSNGDISGRATRSSDAQSGSMPTMPTMPEAGFPANPFDFSSMAGLLNDPNIKELAAQIAKDPSLNRMTEQLQQTFHAPDEGVPQFDTQQCYSTMQQVMQNPQFMTMAERLGNVMMQTNQV
uniref:STI1 domain-containing protein n=1 Tax=Lactuca sativa TaxID=4236 RepID=A0A9R1ULS9_LACSA|nr:hypothetical protein LSAT_V11C800398100 [Lactuca sativa]